MPTNPILTIRKLIHAMRAIRNFARDPMPTENTVEDALVLIAMIAGSAIEAATGAG
jgi:hypothetical protein